jgi:beta-lactamase superfamily II metal-dependent hydrolase
MIRPALALLLLAFPALATKPAGSHAARPAQKAATPGPEPTCAAQQPMRVRFYSVGQGLSALVQLPDGRNILVDSGPPVAHHLSSSLQRDLAGKPLDLLWITHQHIDHIGGADNVMAAVPVKVYADNGRLLKTPEVTKARNQATKIKAAIKTWGPGVSDDPLPQSKTARIRAIVPPKWVPGCASDENDCSIGLRIDYCQSSVLFTGDMETEEEAIIDPKGQAGLLQLAHHGSDTSSGPKFLSMVKPQYAVISAGPPQEGANIRYCHPRASTVQRVTDLLGGPGALSINAYDAKVPCGSGTSANWVPVKTSDRLRATERDGDVIFVTKGDGSFTIENQPAVNARALMYMRSLAAPRQTKH